MNSNIRRQLEEKIEEIQRSHRRVSTVFSSTKIQRQKLSTMKLSSLFGELERFYSSLKSQAMQNSSIYDKFVCVAVPAYSEPSVQSKLFSLIETNSSRQMSSLESDIIQCNGRYYYPDSGGDQIRRLYNAEKSQFFGLIEDAFSNPRNFINSSVYYVRGGGQLSIPDQTQLIQMIDFIPDVLKTMNFYFFVTLSHFLVVMMKYKE